MIFTWTVFVLCSLIALALILVLFYKIYTMFYEELDDEGILRFSFTVILTIVFILIAASTADKLF